MSGRCWWLPTSWVLRENPRLRVHHAEPIGELGAHGGELSLSAIESRVSDDLAKLHRYASDPNRRVFLARP